MEPVQFPPGEVVIADRPFREAIFPEIDSLLAHDKCPDGRLELNAGDKRLICLIHKSAPHSAGLQDGDLFSSVHLKDFPVLSRQMEGARCTLVRTDAILVLMIAVQFRHRPALQATTELVDPNHVLEVLAREGQDAALVLDRGGARSLLFLQKGIPARLYFGKSGDDPGEGDSRERFLVYSLIPRTASASSKCTKSSTSIPTRTPARR